jgi:prepilin-type N-terminal cleavage/methylation domain-containing protein
MFKSLAKTRKREGGFTLIELLIVIVILGILAAIVVFAVSGVTNKGNQAACQSDVKTMEVAAEAFYAQNGYGAAVLNNAGGVAQTPPNSLVPGFMHFSSSSMTGTMTQAGVGYSVTYTPPAANTPAGSVAATVTANPTFNCP